jgi:predicted aldo/keto reductase-like oxidoreductase
VFETIQFPFNLVTREPEEKLIPRSRELGLGFIVMKPLCGGQYDNAAFAFEFLNAFPDLVPIPGIELPGQIREIAAIVESGRTLVGQERDEAEAVASRLGKLFCRRCGYCQPCPEGVPITTAMVFDGFLRRFPHKKLVAGPAKAIVEGVSRCTDCGECETKCPYELPIRDTIQKSLIKAREEMER